MEEETSYSVHEKHTKPSSPAASSYFYGPSKHINFTFHEVSLQLYQEENIISWQIKTALKGIKGQIELQTSSKLDNDRNISNLSVTNPLPTHTPTVVHNQPSLGFGYAT